MHRTDVINRQVNEASHIVLRNYTQSQDACAHKNEYNCLCVCMCVHVCAGIGISKESELDCAWSKWKIYHSHAF